MCLCKPLGPTPARGRRGALGALGVPWLLIRLAAGGPGPTKRVRPSPLPGPAPLAAIQSPSHPHAHIIHTPIHPPSTQLLSARLLLLAACLSSFLPPDTFLHGPSAASLTEQAKPTPIPGPVPSLSSGIHSFTYLPRLISSDLSLFSAIFFSIPSYSLFNHPRPDSTKPTQS